MIANFADLWELVADNFGDREYVIHGDQVGTWREFESRASRLAGALKEMGVTPGRKIAIDLWNCPENLETIFAAFKLRAVPFNINYRYREQELTYLLTDSEAAVVVFDASLADRVVASATAVDFPVQLIEVHGEGTGTPGTAAFETLIETHEPATRIERDGDDEYIVYTGGTTGYPKGVVWAHQTTAQLPMLGGVKVDDRTAFVQSLKETEPYSQLVIAPLMHATGLLGAMRILTDGGRVVFCSSHSLDPAEILSLIETHHVRGFSVIGDAIAKPILEALDKARDEGRPYDLSSVESIGNTGGIWSAPIKKGFLRHGSFVIRDGVSATEGAGFATSEARVPEDIETARFRLGPNAKIITEDGRDIVPGSGEIGFLATTGRLPKGYLNDPEKTAKTWPTYGGVRYSVPGDMATIDADGTVTLLGRGSEVVNTGGEKVFVEEVEAAILTHPAVFDTLVIGLPDERWGNRVAAVVALRPSMQLTEREIIDHVGSQIADHKRPRQVIFLETIPRSPTGKADRKTAKELALQAQTASAQSRE
jgi:fatty-acyl-CoA synthase